MNDELEIGIERQSWESDGGRMERDEKEMKGDGTKRKIVSCN